MNEADALGALLGKAGATSREPIAPPPVDAPAPAPPTSTGSEPGDAVRFWSIMVLGVLISAAWIFTSVFSLEQAFMSGTLGQGLTNGQIDLVASGVVFAGLLVIAGVLCRLTPITHDRRALGAVAAPLVGIALGASGMLLALLQAWVGNHAIIGEEAASGITATWLMASLMTLFAAAVEEIIFRGWLQRRLAPRLGVASAVTVAALAFSALHVFGGARSGMSLVNIFLAGLFFGLLLQRTGSLRCAIAAHFAWNWAEVELLGLDPNPGSPPNGSIFNLDLVGASFWGGSPEGLNASLPVTVVMVALILPLLALRPGAPEVPKPA
jgi:membrane protease YdiL (CAAX protease family)